MAAWRRGRKAVPVRPAARTVSTRRPVLPSNAPPRSTPSSDGGAEVLFSGQGGGRASTGHKQATFHLERAHRG